MASQKQITRANRLLHQIQKSGTIHKYDLMDLCGMSVTDYNNIAGWFRYRYEETSQMVEYNPKTKSWRWIGRGNLKEIEEAMKPKKIISPEIL